MALNRAKVIVNNHLLILLNAISGIFVAKKTTIFAINKLSIFDCANSFFPLVPYKKLPAVRLLKHSAGGTGPCRYRQQPMNGGGPAGAAKRTRGGAGILARPAGAEESRPRHRVSAAAWAGLARWAVARRIGRARPAGVVHGSAADYRIAWHSGLALIVIPMEFRRKVGTRRLPLSGKQPRRRAEK